MKEQSIIEVGESRPVWESLEGFARQGVQRLLQQVLEEEVEEALGRARYERRDGVVVCSPVELDTDGAILLRQEGGASWAILHGRQTAGGSSRSSSNGASCSNS